MPPESYLARAQRWGGQLSSLFAWWLVIEFGLASIVLGVVVSIWPTTPEFLAASAGIWLILLAGCRGFAALAASKETGWATRVAVAEVALCVGTGYMVLHAEWPARASANAISLTFAAAVVAAGALLDGVLARFGPRDQAQPLVIRAVGWLVTALTLMALMNVSEAVALATAATLIGTVEIVQSVWRLAPGRLEADPPQAPTFEEPPTNVGLALLAPEASGQDAI
jgi:hypothetical protein